jgi:TolB protein
LWSPDGRHIAFRSTRDGNVELYVMRADGSAQRRLTNSQAAERRFAWSPDGRNLAFVRDQEVLIVDTSARTRD